MDRGVRDEGRALGGKAVSLNARIAKEIKTTANNDADLVCCDLASIPNVERKQ